MDENQLLDQLLLEPAESEWLEFKENNDQPELIGQYLSALSNSACLHKKQYGYLIYGIQDKTKRIVGTKLNPSTAKGKGNEGLEPWLAMRLNPRIDFRIFQCKVKDNAVVVFRVDATINTPIEFEHKAYIRVGEHKHLLAKHPEKMRKIWNNVTKSPFELGISLTKQNADDVLAKIDYPVFFDLLKLPLPDNKAGIIERLINEEVITKTGKTYSITNLGGLLFAKQLKDFPTLTRKAVRVIVYSGDNRLNAYKEQEGVKGYATGFEWLINWICDQLPANEFIEQALREEHTMFPKVAVREFVANAIIHQDFSITGAGPMVEIFSQRMEITSPGSPLVKVERFIDHAPRSRNEKLASIMRRMNICEERGSGVDRAINAVELFQLPAPIFESDTDFTRVVLFSHQSHGKMEKTDKIRATYQHCCLRWVCRKYMTNASLRKRLGIEDKNYSSASRIIKDTLEAELIKVSDPANKSNKKKYIPFWS